MKRVVWFPRLMAYKRSFTAKATLVDEQQAH